MLRSIIATALVALSTQAFASSLMDVAPGNTLANVHQAYSKQFFFQKEGAATFVDMQGRSPAYVYVDTSQGGAIAGLAWLSLGEDKQQIELFKEIETRYSKKEIPVLREDNIVACSRLPGGSSFQLKSTIRQLTDGTTLLYSQMPAFSSVSVLRGTASNPSFPLPDWTKQADELEKHKDQFNAYQQAWYAGFTAQMKSALSSMPDFVLCAGIDADAKLDQPIVLGSLVEGADVLQDSTLRVKSSFSVGSVSFDEAQVATVKGLADAVQYEAQTVTTEAFEGVSKELLTRFGTPTITDISVEGTRTTKRFAWSDKARKALLVSLQFAQEKDALTGTVQLTAQTAPH